MSRQSASINYENVDKAKKIVLVYLLVSLRQITVDLHISQIGSVHTILVGILDLKNFVQRLVPKLRSSTQKTREEMIFQETTNTKLMKRIITGDHKLQINLQIYRW